MTKAVETLALVAGRVERGPHPLTPGFVFIEGAPHPRRRNRRQKRMPKRRRKKENDFDLKTAKVGDRTPDGEVVTRVERQENGDTQVWVEGRSTNPAYFSAKLELRGRNGRAHIIEPTGPIREPAHVAQMVALAHIIDRKLENGEYATQAGAANDLGITPMRVSQILNLVFLAPDIQEEVLFMESVDGKEPVRERQLRKVLVSVDWVEQRKVWKSLKPETAIQDSRES